MSDVNKYTEQALERYVQMENPQFAALISGEWGTGKTWFVKNFFATHEFQKKFCYISLFEIKTVNEIDAALIEQISSSFISHGVRIASKIVRHFITHQIGYDFEEIEKIGDKLSKSIPQGIIVCLDDIERSSLPIKIILGYISSLLEQYSANVIVICDTKKIKNKAFRSYYDKIFGTQLTVHPDIESFFTHSVSLFPDGKFKNIINECKNIFFEYFKYYRLKNIRYIRMAIFNVLSLYEHISQHNDNYVKSAIVSTCDALFDKYTEKRKDLSEQIYGKADDAQFKKYILTKYSISYPILNKDLKNFWNDLFSSGIISKQTIDNDFNSSPYNPENTTTLSDLRYFYLLNDDTVRTLYRKMIQELENYQYKTLESILQAASIVIDMEDFKIENRCLDITNYFKNIINNTKFEINSPEDYGFSFTGYIENKFRKQESPEFNEIKEYAFSIYASQDSTNTAHLFERIIQSASSDDYTKLVDKFNKTNKAIDCIFIDIDTVSNLLLSYENETLASLIDFMIDTLENNKDNTKVSHWFNALSIKLSQNIDGLKKEKPLAHYTIYRLIKNIEKITIKMSTMPPQP